MNDLNYLAILVAAVAGFIISGAYYGLVANQLAGLHEAYAESRPKEPAARTMIVEMVRNLVVATAVSILARRLDISSLPAALLLAIGLWVAFPVVLFAGSIAHEQYPQKLAAIHAGDWLLKLLAISVIVGLWK